VCVFNFVRSLRVKNNGGSRHVTAPINCFAEISSTAEEMASPHDVPYIILSIRIKTLAGPGRSRKSAAWRKYTPGTAI